MAVRKARRYFVFKGADNRFVNAKHYSVRAICDLTGHRPAVIKRRLAGVGFFDDSHLVAVRAWTADKQKRSELTMFETVAEAISARWLRIPIRIVL